MRQLALLVILLVGDASRAEDWPQFLGPNRNSSADEETIVTRLTSDGQPILWRQPAGQGFSGPVVVGNKVLLFHQPKNEEVLECLSTETGEPLWQIGYRCNFNGGLFGEVGPRATPAIANGTVFTFGASGTLQAVDLATGKLKWRRDLQKEYDVPEGYFGVGTSPVVEGNKLLVTVGAKEASLVAFDCESGKTIWNASNDAASYASPLVATINDRRLALFFARSGLHVVDPSDGKEEAFFRWRARMDASVNAASPVLVDDRIFLSAEYGTGAVLLDLAPDGLKPIWKSLDSLSNHYDTSVYWKGHLFGIDGRQEGGAQLRCIKADTGEVTWTQEGFGCASIIRVKDLLICVTEPGEVILVAANPSLYQENGRQKIGTAPTRAQPALANGVLYVRTPAELVAVDMRGE